ncbi:peptide chain release factor 1, partial [Candidatus Bathyarchaeota archaeon]
SSRRFERLREMHLNEYFTRVGRHMTEIFLNVPNLKGIIVGGPGPTKADFVKGKHIHYELKDKILTVVDTAYTGVEGVKEVVEKSKDFLRHVRFYEERKIVQDFLRHVGHDTGLATYGEREVIQALKNVNVRTLLLSEGVRRARVKLRCRDCSHKETRIVDLDELEAFEEGLGEMRCSSCGNGTYELVEKEDLIEALVKMADEAGADVEMISTLTEEGEMLLKSFGGIAAILKYRQFH